MVLVRSSLRNDYPRDRITCGITNLTLLTADERYGVAFVLILVALSKPGSDMLYKAAGKCMEKGPKGECGSR